MLTVSAVADYFHHFESSLVCYHRHLRSVTYDRVCESRPGPASALRKEKSFLQNNKKLIILDK